MEWNGGRYNCLTSSWERPYELLPYPTLRLSQGQNISTSCYSFSKLKVHAILPKGKIKGEKLSKIK